MLLPSLDGGGAERAFVNLANQFVAWGHCVDMVLVWARGPYLSLLDHRVRLIDLAASSRPGSIAALARYLRRERPAVLLSAMDIMNVAALMASRLMRTPVPTVVSSQVHMSSQIQSRHRLQDRLLPWLTGVLYPSASAIIAVSRGVADDLARSTGLPRTAIQVIHNPVVTPELQRQAQAELDDPRSGACDAPLIVSIGRLDRQKDYPSLFHAFAGVLRRRQARLLVLGEGPERDNLETLARKLKIADSLAMPGFVDNPFAYLGRARLFVLSSAWEGFGLVLVEALACGCPVVSTDCPSGPSEILDGGRFGTLVPVGDVAAMTAAIEAALEADVDRASLKARAADFAVAPIARRYLEVLDRCMNGAAVSSPIDPLNRRCGA